MNIELKNFGPIEYLNINFDKNLHLVYGKNAIGKSYAIYCIYCLLKSIKGKNSGYNQRIFSMVDTKEIEYADLLKYLEIEDFDLTNSESITKFYVERIAKDLRESVLKEFQNSLLNTFSSIKNLKNRYNNKNFEIIINIPQSEICKKITIFSKNSENLDFHIELSNKNLELTKKNKGKKKFEIFINENKSIVANSEEELIVKVFAFIYSQLDGIYHELNAGMKEVYFLPASRSGLYQALNSFAPIIAELAQNRFFTKSKKIELPALSEPLSDYFLDLSTIDRKYDNKEFQSFVNNLEETILKGKVDFNEKTKNITYKPSGLNIELNLSEASSMVAELTPLVLYLKHIINHKFTGQDDFSLIFGNSKRKGGFDVLFIEEPEAHLHPEVQVELMKVFAKLTKHNLKIFITSHSNYMFHELNNIILEKGIDTKNIAIYHLIQSKNGSTVNLDMKVTDEGIDDENFQETSEKLYEERMRILEEAQ